MLLAGAPADGSGTATPWRRAAAARPRRPLRTAALSPASSPPDTVPTRTSSGGFGDTGAAGGCAGVISATRTPVSARWAAPYRMSASAAALAYAAASRAVRPLPASRISGVSGEVDAWTCSRVAPGAVAGSRTLACSRVSGIGASRPYACAKLTAAGPDCPPAASSSTTITKAAAV